MTLEFVSVGKTWPDKITEREARKYTCPTCGRLRGSGCFDRHTGTNRSRCHTERFARARLGRILRARAKERVE